jgi:DNA-binding MarR family transcriptional regulator
MADIKSGSAGASHAPPAYRNVARDTSRGEATADDPLIAFVELLFFAYRDFTGQADEVLQEFDFGRAHHRVLHFVNRRPGLRVADLLDILRITKQSLARVLKELVDRGFIAQTAGARDRRERRLYLTPTGSALAAKLAGLQVAQIRQALTGASAVGASPELPGSAHGENVVREFLFAMIGPEHRASIAAAIAASGGPGANDEGTIAEASMGQSTTSRGRL